MKQVGILFRKLLGPRECQIVADEAQLCSITLDTTSSKELRHYLFQWHSSGQQFPWPSAQSLCSRADRSDRSHPRAPAPVSERPFRAPGLRPPPPTGLPGRRASAARLRIVLQEDRRQSNNLYRFRTEI